VIPSKKDLNKRLQFQISESQEKAARACLKKEGITCIKGGYSSGKTSLLAFVAQTLLMVAPSLQQAKINLKSTGPRTYSIKELMNGDDGSDEEAYSKDVTRA
jgi:hypothetical protein